MGLTSRSIIGTRPGEHIQEQEAAEAAEPIREGVGASEPPIHGVIIIYASRRHLVGRRCRAALVGAKRQRLSQKFCDLANFRPAAAMEVVGTVPIFDPLQLIVWDWE